EKSIKVISSTVKYVINSILKDECCGPKQIIIGALERTKNKQHRFTYYNERSRSS
ncbi:unnamed protein product, partial [Rotaria sordida]